MNHWRFDECSVAFYYDGIEKSGYDVVDALNAAESRIAELEAAQRWHVVGDGDLPIAGKSIMFYDSSSEEIYRGVYTASHHWRANYFSEKCETVTHWLPLPEPPEVQE